MEITVGTRDNGDCKMGEGRGRTRDKKLFIGYYAHYLGDGFNHTPNLSITQYTLITNLHMYSLNIK